MHLILMNVAKMCDSFQAVRRGLRCMLAEEMKAVGHFIFFQRHHGQMVDLHCFLVPEMNRCSTSWIKPLSPEVNVPNSDRFWEIIRYRIDWRVSLCL